MMTIYFAYYLDSECYDEALLIEKRQSLVFMCSYKVRKSECSHDY